MPKSKPHVSIGLPVFNGEMYIRQAVDSILAQTYRDFELIICDNASTDNTRQICLDYVQKDDRVKYYRNATNMGAAPNYNRVFLLSSGDYFKWAAHDDVLAPTYLEKCVKILDDDYDKSLVLCHSKVGMIDENGVLVGTYDDKLPSKLDSWKTHERFGHVIRPRSVWVIMGLIRSELLAKTCLHACHIGADLNLLAELSLIGRIWEIPESLFFRRNHQHAYSNFYESKKVVRDYKIQLKWWGENKKGRLLMLPNWMICFEYFKSVNRISLNLSERLLCIIEIGKRLIRTRCVPLRNDLVNAFQLWRFRLRYGRTSERA